MITQFPLDYLHLICLGITKKIIHIWCKGQIPYKESKQHVDYLSGKLSSYNSCFPVEFNRKPRGIGELEYWKGTEYRTFLLYSGPVALKNILSVEKYNHFMLLSVGVRMLLNKNNSQWIPLARKCLEEFIAGVTEFYSSRFITYNMHSLIHLADDAEKFGSIESVSAFPFENYMQDLKHMLRGQSNCLAQVIRRVFERESVTTLFNQEKENDITKCKFSNKKGDNCFLLKNGQVCLVKNHTADIAEVRPFSFKQPFFHYPIESQTLNIFLLRNLGSTIRFVNITDIVTKCVLIPSHVENQFVSLPLINWL